MCREEAAGLSSLKPQLDAAKVPLYAVVHQRFGVDGFQPSFKGDVYFDLEKRFYGPQERWMSLWQGVLRPGVWMNIWRASRGGFQGNLEGEGRMLGGVFVIGKGDQGILLEHRESEWGDHVDLAQVLDAVKKIR